MFCVIQESNRHKALVTRQFLPLDSLDIVCTFHQRASVLRVGYHRYLCKCFFFSADIDDMNICYVLRDSDNATNDIFSFSIEDSGKSLYLNPPGINYALWLRLKWTLLMLTLEGWDIDTASSVTWRNLDFFKKGTVKLTWANLLIEQTTKQTLCAQMGEISRTITSHGFLFHEERRKCNELERKKNILFTDNFYVILCWFPLSQ